MAFFRSFEFDVGANLTEFGFFIPAANSDGSVHEFLYLYGPFRLATEVSLPQGSPAPSGSAPAANSNQVGVMK